MDREVTSMLELEDRNVKMVMINMSKDLVEKTDNVHEQRGKTEIIKQNQI